MYSNLDDVQSLDIHQLGYMILWLTHFNERVNEFHFAGNTQYHTMDQFTGLQNESELVQHMIRRGTIFDNADNCTCIQIRSQLNSSNRTSDFKYICRHLTICGQGEVEAS